MIIDDILKLGKKVKEITEVLEVMKDARKDCYIQVIPYMGKILSCELETSGILRKDILRSLENNRNNLLKQIRDIIESIIFDNSVSTVISKTGKILGKASLKEFFEEYNFKTLDE